MDEMYMTVHRYKEVHTFNVSRFNDEWLSYAEAKTGGLWFRFARHYVDYRRRIAQAQVVPT